MTWREYIRHRAPPARDGGPRLRPAAPPAAAALLDEAEADLGIALPHDLRDLLTEMDGVDDGAAYLRLILPARGIAEQNRSMRALEGFRVAFDRLLFFAQAGNGDLYGFPIEAGAVREDTVIEWDHEVDEATRVASSLRDFLHWWATTRPWS